MNAFLKTAVVGTAQQGTHIPTTASAIDPLTQQLPAETGERSFLLAAGAQAIYAQAGMIAAEAPAPLDWAEPDTLAPCSMRVAHLIEGLFQQPASVLLPEALQRLQKLQLRLPHEVLPQYISYSTAHREIRGAVAPLLGERGLWLSQFVPEWKWIATQQQQEQEDAEAIWQEGTPEQRQQVLQRLRKQDPARAREWVQEVWKQEKAEVRSSFLTQMRSGLSLDDQGFLEQVLLDRSEGVREQAADLILLLPETPLTQRFLAAADEFISYDPARKQNRLTINLPGQLDAARKEALALTPQFSEKLKTEDWLHHAFRKIAPRHWEERLNISPEEFIAELDENTHGISNVEDGTYGQALIKALQYAARRHHAVSWYQPLLRYYIQHELQANKRLDHNLCREMLAELPQTVAETLVEPLMRDKNIWPTAIEILPAPWSQPFSLLCLQQLRTYYTNAGSTNYHFWNATLPIVASSINPSCLEAAKKPWEIAEDDTSWYVQHQKQQVATFLELIEIRKQLIEEIA